MQWETATPVGFPKQSSTLVSSFQQPSTSSGAQHHTNMVARRRHNTQLLPVRAKVSGPCKSAPLLVWRGAHGGALGASSCPERSTAVCRGGGGGGCLKLPTISGRVTRLNPVGQPSQQAPRIQEALPEGTAGNLTRTDVSTLVFQDPPLFSVKNHESCLFLPKKCFRA